MTSAHANSDFQQADAGSAVHTVRIASIGSPGRPQKFGHHRWLESQTPSCRREATQEGDPCKKSPHRFNPRSWMFLQQSTQKHPNLLKKALDLPLLPNILWPSNHVQAAEFGRSTIATGRPTEPVLGSLCNGLQLAWLRPRGTRSKLNAFVNKGRETAKRPNHRWFIPGRDPHGT